MIDATVMEALETNELWPTVMPEADGTATSSFMNEHVARPDALSVVIHHAVADPPAKVSARAMWSDGCARAAEQAPAIAPE